MMTGGEGWRCLLFASYPVGRRKSGNGSPL
jgi:hypothetical protein